MSSWKYHFIKEILHTWHGKPASANYHFDGALLQEEALKIKERLNKEEVNYPLKMFEGIVDYLW